MAKVFIPSDLTKTRYERFCDALARSLDYHFCEFEFDSGEEFVENMEEEDSIDDRLSASAASADEEYVKEYEEQTKYYEEEHKRCNESHRERMERMNDISNEIIDDIRSFL